jgi:hypothetical protein
MNPTAAEELPDLDDFAGDLDHVEGVKQRGVEFARLETGEVGGDAQVRAAPER